MIDVHEGIAPTRLWVGTICSGEGLVTSGCGDEAARVPLSLEITNLTEDLLLGVWLFGVQLLAKVEGSLIGVLPEFVRSKHQLFLRSWRLDLTHLSGIIIQVEATKLHGEWLVDRYVILLLLLRWELLTT